MIGFGIQEFFIVHIVALSIGHFNHSNIQIPLGPFKYLFNNPQMHTWHHAKAYPSQYRYGINFGISLSLWDYLFRTVHFPNSGEHIELGYPGDEEMPHTFLGQAVFGLKKKKKPF
jgi:sterol desaturase/sphingolipid hydroxylase (fatty acid hydroxylase superfamily)